MTLKNKMITRKRKQIRQTKFKLKRKSRISRKLGGSIFNKLQQFQQTGSTPTFSNMYSVARNAARTTARNTVTKYAPRIQNQISKALPGIQNKASGFLATSQKSLGNAVGKFGSSTNTVRALSALGNSAKSARNAARASLGTAKNATYRSLGTARNAAQGIFSGAAGAAQGIFSGATGAASAAKSIGGPLTDAGVKTGKAMVSVGSAVKSLGSSNFGEAAREIIVAGEELGIAAMRLTAAGIQSTKTIINASKLALKLSADTAKAALIGSAYTTNAVTRGFFKTLKLVTMSGLIAGKTLEYIFDIGLSNLESEINDLNEIKKKCEIPLNRNGNGNAARLGGVRMDPQKNCINNYINFLTNFHKSFIKTMKEGVIAIQLEIKSNMNLIKSKIIEIGCKRGIIGAIFGSNTYICKNNNKEEIYISEGDGQILLSKKYINIVELKTDFNNTLSKIFREYNLNYKQAFKSIKYYKGKSMNEDFFNLISKYIDNHDDVATLKNLIDKYSTPITMFLGVVNNYISVNQLKPKQIEENKTEIEKNEIETMIGEVHQLDGQIDQLDSIEKLKIEQKSVDEEADTIISQLKIPVEPQPDQPMTNNNIGNRLDTMFNPNAKTIANANGKTKTNAKP